MKKFFCVDCGDEVETDDRDLVEEAICVSCAKIWEHNRYYYG